MLDNHFNPRSPHGERHAAEKCLDGNAEYFNPRSPHGERLDFPAFADSQQPFQSTLPARGATAGAGGRTCATRYFNPRSPHGERQVKARAKRLDEKISIHAPRTGSDGSKATPVQRRKPFQSTLPARGATASTPSCTQRMLYFNPRSPHGERLIFLHLQTVNNYFNPRSPHGERQSSCTVVLRFPHYIFQSTLPARGATFLPPVLTTSCDDFNPRSPHGERRRERILIASNEISIHAPRTGSDGAHFK